MFQEVQREVDFIVQDGQITCKPKQGSFDTPTILKLQELQKHEANTVHLLRTDPEAAEIVIAVDIETTDLKPMQGEIQLISMFGAKVASVSEIDAATASVLANPTVKKVFHNAGFDVTWLRAKGFEVNNFTDTMIMSQILHNTAKSNNSLQALALQHLNIILDKSLQSSENWQDETTEKHKVYALKDAEVTFQLYHLFQQRISDGHLDVVLDREMRAMNAMIELNLNGLRFDYNAWSVVLAQLKEESTGLEALVRKLLGDAQLNLSSPSQLKDAFSKGGLELESTADEYLARYEEDHEAIVPLRQFKKMKKLLSSYGEKLRQQIDADGRLRGNHRMIGTDTSRMTCTQPNLQGIPSIAKPFVKAEEGEVLIIADYSAIELRVLAELSGDEEMKAAFINGDDLHAKTARSVLQIPLSQPVSDDERKVGKVVGLGLVYGMTKYGLRKKIEAATGEPITLQQAEEFRSRYFELYPCVLNFQDQMLKADHITTLGGRYWSAKSTSLKQGAISRYNYPVQGTAAEGFKEALSIVSSNKPKEWLLVAAVHDEIVLEVPVADAEKAKKFLIGAMKEGMSQLIKSVPIEVECQISDHWSK